jgi:hypothetical protein
MLTKLLSPSQFFFHLPVTLSSISQSLFITSPSHRFFDLPITDSSISQSQALPSPSHCLFHLPVTVSSISQSPCLPSPSYHFFHLPVTVYSISQSQFLRHNLLFRSAIVLNDNGSEHNPINCSRPLQLCAIQDTAGLADRHEILPVLINIWIA